MSQGQNLALTVLHVPYSLDRAVGHPNSEMKLNTAFRRVFPYAVRQGDAQRQKNILISSSDQYVDDFVGS